MNIITVIPITRQKVAATLSYFTAEEVPVGAVVSVPLRSKNIHAIVAESRVAEDIKAEIKTAPFEIRKLGKVKAGSFLSNGFIASCKVMADYYATNMGTLLSVLLPETIMENAHRIAPPLPAQPSFLDGTPNPQETYAVQGEDADRMSSWKSLIRQQFARKKSIAIYAPSVEDVRQIFAALEKGIEGYIYVIHGGLPKKKIIDTWTEIAETKHPVVVIATPSFSVLPRGDIESVVLERENGRGWMTMRAPYLDLRMVIESIARRERRTVFVADAMLRIETLYRLEKGEISEGTPFKWRSVGTTTDTLVSMNHDKAVPGIKVDGQFQVLSDELENLIRKNREESTHLFIMSSRRGLATLTVCSDCENIVSCVKCGTPVVLHVSKQSGRNFYMCHSCGERRAAEDICAVCAGMRLTPLGVGTERVASEIRKIFPEVEVFQVDADTTSTEKQVVSAIEGWRAAPGTVLVGTETALTHLYGQVDHVAVASLDSLFALPDFRIQERLMYMLVRLRSIARQTITVQTRRPEEKVFEYGLKGNLSDFYRSVLAERKRFEYPPFSLIIKITLEGDKATIAKEMGELQAYFAPHEIEVFPAFTTTSRGTSLIHGVIRIREGQWPDMDLVEKFREMPPSISIKINPESLL